MYNHKVPCVLYKIYQVKDDQSELRQAYRYEDNILCLVAPQRGYTLIYTSGDIRPKALSFILVIRGVWLARASKVPQSFRIRVEYLASAKY